MEKALNLINDEDFEIIDNLSSATIKEQTKNITSSTKWIIIEETSSITHAWNWFSNGFSLQTGALVEVNIIFIQSW